MIRNTSAEITLLIDIVDLAKRCGLRASDADASIDFDINREDQKAYRLSFVWRDAPGIKQFRELLDVKGDLVWASDIDELQDRVNTALSLAPRARAR